MAEGGIGRQSRIFVAGHRGMVGSAILRQMRRDGWAEPIVATSDELDLRDQSATYAFLERQQPDAVIVAAARVGGIYANSEYPAEFLFDNLAIAQNLIHGSYRANVGRVLFLGSACIYPRDCAQPIREEYLLTGPLEPTNEPYAIAKIAGLKLCESYRRQYGVTYHSAMPTNLYGTGDNYHRHNSHVLPGLIRRFHEAKVAGQAKVTMWGTGKPLREFLHTDDCASAILHLLRVADPLDWVNIGSGDEISIGDLARMVADVVGFAGEIENDLEKPDGTPRKLLDSTQIRSLGWSPRIDLREGIKRSYVEFLAGDGRR